MLLILYSISLKNMQHSYMISGLHLKKTQKTIKESLHLLVSESVLIPKPSSYQYIVGST